MAQQRTLRKAPAYRMPRSFLPGKQQMCRDDSLANLLAED